MKSYSELQPRRLINDLEQPCNSLILSYFISICRHHSIIRCIWASTLISSEITVPTDLLTELLILRRLIMVDGIPSKRIDIVCGAAELRNTALPVLLLSQYLLYLTLRNRWCRSFDLSVNVFHLSHAALAEVAGWCAPCLLLFGVKRVDCLL